MGAEPEARKNRAWPKEQHSRPATGSAVPRPSGGISRTASTPQVAWGPCVALLPRRMRAQPARSAARAQRSSRPAWLSLRPWHSGPEWHSPVAAPESTPKGESVFEVRPPARASPQNDWRLPSVHSVSSRVCLSLSLPDQSSLASRPARSVAFQSAAVRARSGNPTAGLPYPRPEDPRLVYPRRQILWRPV